MNNVIKEPEHRHRQTKFDRRFKIVRDIVLFTVGIGGIIHEEFFTTSDRHWLILVYGGMLGLTTWLHIDEHRSGE